MTTGRPELSGLLAGTVSVVAVSAAGIGQAVAYRLARCGSSVELADIDAEGLNRTVQVIRDAGGHARGTVLNASDDGEVAAFMAAVRKSHGRLDSLVNSVGVQRYGTVETTPVSVWDEVMAINLRSMFLMARYAVPLMRVAGGGAIVNVSSTQAVATQRNVVAYSASKGAIVTFTRAMAVDHAAEGIRVNCVLPGSIDTPMLRASAAEISPDNPDTVVAAWGAGHPLGRVGQPAEVADACAFLVSRLASFITGAELRVDGGVLAGVALAAPKEADAPAASPSGRGGDG